MSVKRFSLRLRSRSTYQTWAIGRILGEALRGGDCIALIGELGAGKTCFTQGIARGLGVSEAYAVTSPTFTLINEYDADRTRLIHMDLFRLKGTADLEDMGFEEYMRSGNVMVIEWAEKIQEVLPEETLTVHCVYVSGNERYLEIEGPEKRLHLLAQSLEKGGR